MKATPIHEIFLHRARGVGHLLRNRPVFNGMTGFASNEALSVELIPGKGGNGPTIRYWRKHWNGHNQGYIEFGNVNPMDPTHITFGPETVLRSEELPAVEEPIHNGGFTTVTVKFEDVFGKESASEKTKEASAGTSVKVSIESEQSVEGVAKFKESVEAEAHAEVSESSTQAEASSQEIGGGEETEVPAGKSVIITASRKRVDTAQDVTAQGAFTHTVVAGQFSHHTKHPWHYVAWDSWEQFKDCVNGDAPDNWPLATVFKEHPVFHGDLWALKDINAPLRYRVKFEGKIIRTFDVRKAGPSGGT